MKLQSFKFRRAMWLNRDPLTFLPDAIFHFTRTPRFGRRARSIIRALQMIRHGINRNRNRLVQVAEFGVARGEGFRQLVLLTMHFCDRYNINQPMFYAFDTFSGLPSTNHPADVGTWRVGDYPGDEQELAALLLKMGVLDRCKIVKGLFADTLPAMGDDFAPDLLLIDCDYYTSTRAIFENLKDRLSTGTVVYFDDIGTNFYNPAFGEERLIHELNRGELGRGYYLHPITDFLYYWSNSAMPVAHKTSKILDVPLRCSTKLTDFY